MVEWVDDGLDDKLTSCRSKAALICLYNGGNPTHCGPGGQTHTGKLCSDLREVPNTDTPCSCMRK